MLDVKGDGWSSSARGRPKSGRQPGASVHLGNRTFDVKEMGGVMAPRYMTANWMANGLKRPNGLYVKRAW